MSDALMRDIFIVQMVVHSMNRDLLYIEPGLYSGKKSQTT